MRSFSLLAAAAIYIAGLGLAHATDSMLVAEHGGFLLGNAHRCGVATDRVARTGKVVGDLIAAAAADQQDADEATSRFAKFFLVSASPDQKVVQAVSCKFVVSEFERLEQHRPERVHTVRRD